MSHGHPDFNDYLIHFTGREGQSNRNAEIANLSDRQRLQRILIEHRFIAANMFGTSAPAVCFTESTRPGVEHLIRTRYTPCAVAFRKDFMFQRGGGPALYVRGDEWHHVANWPSELRARATRYWPGSTRDNPTEYVPTAIENRSEWLEEREWRVLPRDDGYVRFEWSNVEFLIVPDLAWFDELDEQLREGPQESFVGWWASRPFLVMNSAGQITGNEGVPLRER